MKTSEFRKLIREEVRKVVMEDSKQDFLKMMQDYIEAEYAHNEGWGKDARNAPNVMKHVETELSRLKGKQYFNYLKQFSELNMDIEYAIATADADAYAAKQEILAKKLGFTKKQLLGINI